MPEFLRSELEEMVDRWITTNQTCESERDWRPLADLYAPDATYGWNLGPKEEFMAVGRDEIRDIALGAEMGGLDGWEYPYERVLIDEKLGEVIGLWRQLADSTDALGNRYEIAGIGGSWFGYAGNFTWAWQRDFFDVGNATHTFIEMIKANALSAGMQARIERASSKNLLPGHYVIGQGPSSLWPKTTN